MNTATRRIIAIALLLGLSACGIKGPLKPPPAKEPAPAAERR